MAPLHDFVVLCILDSLISNVSWAQFFPYKGYVSYTSVISVVVEYLKWAFGHPKLHELTILISVIIPFHMSSD